MKAYVSSIDALMGLLEPDHRPSIFGSCHVTKIPQNIHRMPNGIEYCAIEVSCDDNTQYGIQAYGKEAIDLHKEAFRLSGNHMELK